MENIMNVWADYIEFIVDYAARNNVNVFQARWDLAVSEYSDAYKDCYGIRPRLDISDWTLEDLYRETDRCYT